jgi:tRNA threonylcarbamoyladenosine biosynthesis protein TsaE
MKSLEVITRSSEETEDLGVRLGKLLPAGTIVALSGTLGAGKTHLTRGLALGLGVDHPEAVNSPTFVLIQEYQGPIPLYHFDTYRLKEPRDFALLGAEEYLEGHGVCVIEWAERVQEYLPESRLTIQIEHHGETTRRITLSTSDNTLSDLLDRLHEPDQA